MSKLTELQTKKCWIGSDIYAECAEIAALVGSEAEVAIVINFNKYSNRKEPVAVLVDLKCGAGSKHFNAATFTEALQKAREYAAGASDEYQRQVVRRMALAIIDITDRLGKCADLNLRADKFSVAEISAFHLQACEAASRMSGNAPFAVIMSVSAAA